MFNNKRFSAVDSIWIAAAVYTFKQYNKTNTHNISDFYLKAPELRELALEYSTHDVQLARIHQHCNGDHANPSHKFLRRLEGESNSPDFRLTAKGEFGEDREAPDSLNLGETISVEGKEVLLSTIMEFVEHEYTEFVKQNVTNSKNTVIDYLSVLNYLERNALKPYAGPEKTVPIEQRSEMDELKVQGQAAVSEMKKMAELCKNKFGLDKCTTIKWLDGSNIKAREYLWAQMRYTDFESRPESISIFVDKDPDTLKARYRFSLEIVNKGADKAIMNQYHSHLDLPQDTEHGLVYVEGSNEDRYVTVLHEDRETVRQKVYDGTYEKVQLCRIIAHTEELTNEECENVMLEGVAALIPYYKHVLQIEDDEKGVFKEMVEKENFALNMILYGPPGTGKTYNSAIYAVAICDNKSVKELTDYDDVMERYRVLKKEGRVEFTTFHQSYGYEEFIEGIKPVIKQEAQGESSKELQYEIAPGSFKKFCEEAKKAKVKTDKFEISDDAKVWKATVRSDVRDDCFENNRVRIDWEIDTDGAYGFVNDIKKGDIIITTDGSRTVINGIAVVTKDDAYSMDTDADTTTREVQWLAKEITEEIKPINNGKMLHRMTVARVPGMQISDIIEMAIDKNPDLASTEIEENDKEYVFIIDEINRGNISKIFGELITLIEDTKREGMGEEISAILPYSGDEFSVPQNVYILGTMNTADRSIALMDTALRRRFCFIEMMPKAECLRNIGADKVIADGKEIDVASMLERINERIEYLFDREHTIGHAFFISLKDDASIEKLSSIFEKSVIPLLQEYFYEDYSKIQMVLGDNDKKIDDQYKFIVSSEIKAQSIFKGDVSDIDLPDYKYKIANDNFKNAETYIKIYSEL